MKLYKRKAFDCAPEYQPDPYILYSKNQYYIYATHKDGVQLYRSSSLLGEWSYLGLCFQMENHSNYWAPAVIEQDGHYYMYVSCTNTGEDTAVCEGLKVAEAISPEGPFHYACDLLEPFSIDAHVVDYKNEWYLFYSLNDSESERPGTYIAVDKMKSPFEVEHAPVPVVRATLDEEIFCRNRYRPGVHWHTVEGAFYFRIGQTHYLTYSGSAFGQPTYFVGYAVAHGDCGDLRELKWTKYPDPLSYHPLLCANQYVEGTGHNSVICIDHQWWIIYHGRDVNTAHKKEDTRTMRAERLYIEGDQLTIRADHDSESTRGELS